MEHTRRSFIKEIATLAGATGLAGPCAWAGASAGTDMSERGSFSLDGTSLRFRHPAINTRQSFLMLADTHLFRDDERGRRYTEYSGRMAKAYNHTKHFTTGIDTEPEACFDHSLSRMTEKKQSLVALVGDILSFPSEAGVEWVLERLKASGSPHIYTAGNHDWHFEGMPGSSSKLRQTWCTERLKPLYADSNTLFHCRPMGEVDLIIIDNSTYEIQPEQLAFFHERDRKGRPMLVLLHIPLYVPGRPLGFGCGHPDWSAKNDRSWQLERREPWRSEGHTRTTMEFHRAVFHSKHVIGILAGHIHKPSIDIVNGIPQVVCEANARGGFLDIDLLSASDTTGS